MSVPEPTLENWAARGRHWTLYSKDTGLEWARCLDGGEYLAVIQCAKAPGSSETFFAISHRPTGRRLSVLGEFSLESIDALFVLDCAHALDRGLGAEWVEAGDPARFEALISRGEEILEGLGTFGSPAGALH